MMDEKGDLLADSHDILNKFKSFLLQLLNVHGVSHVRQLEIHAAEPLVPECIPLKAEIVT
jgi:hypothetical protein